MECLEIHNTLLHNNYKRFSAVFTYKNNAHNFCFFGMSQIECFLKIFNIYINSPMRCLSCMFPNMVHHVLFPSECLGAILTSIGGFPRVTPCVILKVFFSGKGFTAHGAVVRFVSGMPLHVALQRGGVRKNVKTHAAGKHAAT